MKVPRGQSHGAEQASLLVVDREGEVISMERGCHVIMQEAWLWTTVGNVLDRHALCKLKTSFVDKKQERVGHCSRYKRLNIWSLPNSPYLSRGRQKSLTRLTIPVHHFYIVCIHIIELVFVLNIAEILLAGCYVIIN